MIKARRAYSIIFLFFLSIVVLSQNIVSNGSFETYSACPVSVNSGSPDEVAKSVGWYRIRQTPDYFNSCASGTIVNTPINFFGFQNPSSGNSYMGLWSYDSGTSNFRECIASKLTSTLVIGQKYFVKITVSNAEGYTSNCGIDKIGLRFSTVKHSITALPPINNFAHLYFTSIMADTLNWNSVFKSFVADSSYQYVEIGNFFNDLNTNVQVLKSQIANLAYYYIDDVALSTDSLEALGFNSTTVIDELKLASKIEVYPNPVEDFLFLKDFDQFSEFKLYNLIGNEVKFEVMKGRLDFTNIAPGIYFLYCKRNGEVYKCKILKK